MGLSDPYSAGSPPPHGHSSHGQQQLSSAESGSLPPALEALLETECMALMALEATRAGMRVLPGDHQGEEADIGGAIELLRHAIAELRARSGEAPPSLLALGFVIDQARPARTA